MKKLFIVIAALLSYSHIPILSNDNQVLKLITIDFQNKTITKDIENISEGEYFQVVINNINLNNYHVIVTNTDTTIKTNPKFPSNSIINMIAPIVAPLMPNYKLISDRNTQPEETEEVNEKLETLDNQYNDIVETHNYLYKAISVEVYNAQNGYIYPTDLSQSFLLQFQNKIIEIANKYSDLINSYNLLKSQYTITNEILLNSINGRILAISRNKVMLGSTALNTTIKNLQTMMTNVPMEYKSLPMRFNGNQGTVTIQVIPRDSNSLAQSYTTQIDFPDKSIFSFNVGAMTYFSPLKNDSYSINKRYEDLPDGTRYEFYTAENEGSNRYENGVALTANLGITLTEYLEIGPVVGIGTPLSTEPIPRFMLGLFVGIGLENKLTLQYGIINGQVNSSNGVFEDAQVRYSSSPDLVDQKHTSNWFFGIGYSYEL